LRHRKSVIVAGSVEMLSDRRKKDYAAESAVEALENAAEKDEDDAAAAAAEPIPEEVAA
jgi:nitroimidazol reductase NimA-like FMN-containing flavoprotein (pyridoxamine 5'-phosphate oxidase superfamily)